MAIVIQDAKSTVHQKGWRPLFLMLIASMVIGCYQKGVPVNKSVTENLCESPQSQVPVESSPPQVACENPESHVPHQRSKARVVRDNSDIQIPRMSLNTRDVGENPKLKQHRARGKPELKQEEGLVMLEEFLEQAGNDLNCWFTVEQIDALEDSCSALDAASVVPVEVQSIDELVTKLRSDLENVQVVVSSPKR